MGDSSFGEYLVRFKAAALRGPGNVTWQRPRSQIKELLEGLRRVVGATANRCASKEVRISLSKTSFGQAMERLPIRLHGEPQPRAARARKALHTSGAATRLYAKLAAIRYAAVPVVSRASLLEWQRQRYLRICRNVQAEGEVDVVPKPNARANFSKAPSELRVTRRTSSSAHLKTARLAISAVVFLPQSST